jgi:hypothetical protein
MELAEAYQRLHRTGPEFEGWLSNHGPMVAEAMIRRGHDGELAGWLDRYVRRLEDLPSESDPIDDVSWQAALGDPRRLGDWTAYLTRQIDEQPWRSVLETWWKRLIGGIVAGATHGVIRVGHAAQHLLTESDDRDSQIELAQGLGYWAARYQTLPGTSTPHGGLSPADALASVPRIAVQEGGIRPRLTQLEDSSDWTARIGALQGSDTAAQAEQRLRDLTTAAATRYLHFGHGNGVMMVHSATAPRAVLRALPALPERLWPASADAAWYAAAAITAAYAPALPAPRPGEDAEPATPDEVFARAADHGDEHAIKFVDTAIDVYDLSGDRTALHAASRALDLIPRPS